MNNELNIECNEYGKYFHTTNNGFFVDADFNKDDICGMTKTPLDDIVALVMPDVLNEKYIKNDYCIPVLVYDKKDQNISIINNSKRLSLDKEIAESYSVDPDNKVEVEKFCASFFNVVSRSLVDAKKDHKISVEDHFFPKYLIGFISKDLTIHLFWASIFDVTRFATEVSKCKVSGNNYSKHPSKGEFKEMANSIVRRVCRERIRSSLLNYLLLMLMHKLSIYLSLSLFEGSGESVLFFVLTLVSFLLFTGMIINMISSLVKIIAFLHPSLVRFSLIKYLTYR